VAAPRGHLCVWASTCLPAARRRMQTKTAGSPHPVVVSSYQKQSNY